MPAKSAKQYKFMQAIVHGAKKSGGIGPTKDVAKEFIQRTSPEKRSQFMKGKR